MRRPARIAAAFAALFMLTGCGTGPFSGRPCTAIGAPVGVRLDIPPPFADKVARASMKICWDGTCHTPEIHLRPSTTAAPRTCSGSDPEDACAASAVPTRGQHGFARVPTLPTEPVQVTVMLRAGSDEPVLDQTVEVTPEMVFPNGPHCAAAGPQAGLSVHDGRLRERP